VIERNRLVIGLDRRQIALERWSVSGKKELFQEVFGLDVVISPREEA